MAKKKAAPGSKSKRRVSKKKATTKKAVAKKAATRPKAKKKKKTATAKRTSRTSSSRPKPRKQSSPKLGEPLPIVGVGASAGGLEAFQQLLEALPSDSGMAFVLVQHMAPSHESMLKDILEKTATMPIVPIRNNTEVLANHIYVIRPNTEIQISKGVLKTAKRQEADSHRVIDRFFQSLAEDQTTRAIGVILSGSAMDGTLGLRAIKASDGITFAQDPATAKFASMPYSAISTGCVDRVLSPERIAEQLVHISRHPYVNHQEPETPVPFDEEVFRKILALVRKAAGVDLAHYKPSTLKRRILRRVALERQRDPKRYLEDLQKNPGKVHELYQDLLIQVTSFFRESETFRALREQVFPHLLKAAGKGEIRVWVPGCSTGEEAYSLAILLLECLHQEARTNSIQIFGTDLSDEALQKARAGIYPESIEEQVSAEHLRQYFRKVEEGYRINKPVRHLCLFAKHDLAKDPPFSRLDLISCQNVLIYMKGELQKRVAAVFHYALKPTGFLVLGKSETLGGQSHLFSCEDQKYKIFTKRAVPTPHVYDFSPTQLEERMTRFPRKEPSSGHPPLLLQTQINRLILERYKTAGVVVDANFEIVQFYGETGPYISPSPGEPSLDLLKMVQPELGMKLRGAMRAAKKSKRPIRHHGLHIKSNGGFPDIDLEIIPLKGLQTANRYLVLFEKARAVERPSRSSRKKQGAPERNTSRETKRLEQELATTQQQLQVIIEDKEAANEQLQAANEEIQASNEELKSTNEELETAKEELQSNNEELTTVNEELENRNTELVQLADDLNNVFASINLPIIIVGANHRIRRFTPAAEGLFNLLPGDVGRPLEHLKPNVEIPDLDRLINQVIQRVEHVERTVTDREGRSYSLQMRPYKTTDNKIDGVLMALVHEDLANEKAGSTEGDSREWIAGVLSFQDEERRRISRELHDDLNQHVAALTIDVERLSKDPPGSTRAVSRKLGELKTRLDDLSEHIRSLSHDLHPSTLDHLGLQPALEALCNETSEKNAFSVRFTHRELPESIPPEIRLCLYRVAQECLRNIQKHADASEAKVALTKTGKQLHLSVEDDGKGLDTRNAADKTSGLGIASMRERVKIVGGRLEVDSKRGRGTRVHVWVPISPAKRVV